MKDSKTVRIVIVAVVLAVIVLVFFSYQGNRSKRQQVSEAVSATVVQNVLMKDLEHSYPPTPKEVVKYYAEITECFYNEEYSDEDLTKLANKIQHLYDVELIANQENYLEDLRQEIQDMKKNKYTIASYEVSASTDVEYFDQGQDSCARLYCTFNIKQDNSSRITSLERFVLRKDVDGHWKILGWELVED